jgi:replication fork clamp-binding protein CrfC
MSRPTVTNDAKENDSSARAQQSAQGPSSIATKYGFNLHLEIYVQFLNESLQNLHQRIMQLKFSKKYRTNHGNIYIIAHNTMLYRLVIPL